MRRPVIAVLFSSALTLVAAIGGTGCSGSDDASSGNATGLPGAAGGGNGGGDNGNGSNAASSSQAASSADFCKTFCGRITTCDKSIDEETCAANCTNDLKLEAMRGDYVTKIVACWNKLSCAEVLETGSLGSCRDEALAMMTPSETASAFCGELEKNLAKCDVSLEKAQCLNLSKSRTDATIEKAKKCGDKSCSNIMPCISATFDIE